MEVSCGWIGIMLVVSSRSRIPQNWRLRKERLTGNVLQYKKFEEFEGREKVIKKRCLRYRNWEVVLDGSVRDFGKNVIKKVLATAGLRERPKETSKLVLSLMSRQEDWITDQLDVLAKGMISGAGEVKLEVKEGVLLAANDLAAGGELDAVQLARVAQGAGLDEYEALKYVKITMDGASEEAIRKVYLREQERVRV